METKDATETENLFLGVWMADFREEADIIISNIQFLKEDFNYYIIRMDTIKGGEKSRVHYKGKYTYNENSSVIFFTITEPASEAGVTSSSYQFSEGKLYCYGNKFLVTEKLHEKVNISQYIG